MSSLKCLLGLIAIFSVCLSDIYSGKLGSSEGSEDRSAMSFSYIRSEELERMHGDNKKESKIDLKRFNRLRVIVNFLSGLEDIETLEDDRQKEEVKALLVLAGLGKDFDQVKNKALALIDMLISGFCRDIKISNFVLNDVLNKQGYVD